MFRASSAHLQEDIVVHMQHMVLIHGQKNIKFGTNSIFVLMFVESQMVHI